MRISGFWVLAAVSVMLIQGCSVKPERSSANSTYPKGRKVTRIVQYNVGVFSKEIDNSIPMIASMMKEIGADALSLN